MEQHEMSKLRLAWVFTWGRKLGGLNHRPHPYQLTELVSAPLAVAISAMAQPALLEDFLTDTGPGLDTLL